MQTHIQIEKREKREKREMCRLFQRIVSQVRGAVTDVLRTEVLRMWQPEKIVQAELTKMEILESTRVEAAIKILVKAERMAQVAETMAQVAETMAQVAETMAQVLV